jgi:NADH-quinone oxidoreductase subunit J
MLHLALVVASTRPTWPDILVFAASAAVVLVGALGVVTSGNPVHAALSLVMTLFGVAVLFIEQEADFLAAVQIIVYAGAIVVLFLFVIMFLGVDRREDVNVEPLSGQRPLAFLMLGITLAGVIAMLATAHWVTGAHQVVGPIQGPITKHAGAPSGEVAQLGKQLFTTYLFAFEATAALLVIAVVGAVVLARRPTLSESELAAREKANATHGPSEAAGPVTAAEIDHAHEEAEPGVPS